MVIAGITAISVAIWFLLAEMLHVRRIRRLGRLAFGPSEQPRRWVSFVPLLRAIAFGALAGALALMIQLPPKVHQSAAVPENQKKHIVVVLDVSPSMTLEDAGPEQKASRRNRAKELMESFFQRVPMERYLTSVIACYNGAKPVVIETSVTAAKHDDASNLRLAPGDIVSVEETAQTAISNVVTSIFRFGFAASLPIF